MKILRIMGFIITTAMVMLVSAHNNLMIQIEQLELGLPSGVLVTEHPSGETVIYSDNGVSSITIKTQTTQDIFPIVIAQTLNTTRPEPLSYEWESFSGVPAMVADFTPEGRIGFRHALVVWEGIVYEFSLTPLNSYDDTLNAQTEQLWRDMLENMIFHPLDGSPHFTIFSSDITEISGDPRMITVSWELQNRPENSNLEFVQVLPDGQVENVELPRDNPFVTSIGTGLVNIQVFDNEPTIVLQARLIDYSDNDIITVRQLVLPINSSPPTSTPYSTIIPANHQVTSDPTVIATSESHSLASLTTTDTVAGNTTLINYTINQAFNDGRIIWYPSGIRYVDDINNPTVIATINSAGSTTSGSINWNTPITSPGRYTLYLEVDDEQLAESRIILTCPYSFLVDETNLPGPTLCGASDPITTQAAFQQFENGMMIWLQDTGYFYGSSEFSPEILIMYNSGTKNSIADTWAGEQIIITDNPPDGLVAPRNGFGYAWTTYNYIRDGLGWAISPEQAYTAQSQFVRRLQANTAPSLFYFTLPDGRIIRNDGNLWSFVDI